MKSCPIPGLPYVPHLSLLNMSILTPKKTGKKLAGGGRDETGGGRQGGEGEGGGGGRERRRKEEEEKRGGGRKIQRKCGTFCPLFGKHLGKRYLTS